MPSKSVRYASLLVVLFAAVIAFSEDFHIKKSISVGGNFVSSSESSIKGNRERTVSQGPNGGSVTLRQCDLRRTVTVNEQAQTYLVIDDPQDENAAKAAAIATGVPQGQASGGKIVITTTLTDTGERKKMYGFQARHLKAKVVEEPSADACTQVRQSFEIDGWFADISPEQSACASLAPPVQQGAGCQDAVISRHLGSGKPGYPLQENITMPTPDGGKMTVGIQISEISRQDLPAEMFDVPTGYRKVSSLAELNGGASQTATAQTAPTMTPVVQQTSGGSQANALMSTVKQGMLNPMAAPAANQAALAMAQQQMQMAQSAGIQQMMGANQPTSTQVAAPQALGPKAPGKIRIGVAPPDAQLGQGNNAGADYSTPVRNVEVSLMSGPAVEVVALDSHIAMQLQAEAQQKQCDYTLYSSVAVKHGGGGFGRFAKMAAPVASMVPMAGMAAGSGMGGAVAAQAAGAAASAAAMSAQQQAINQLSGFNGQIKSKDEVTVRYQLVSPGKTSPVAENSLKAKAKSDGEDVLTPLLQQAATSVLNTVTQK